MWYLVAIVAFALCYSPLPWPRPQPVKYKCPTSLKTTKQDWMQSRNDYIGWSWYKSSKRVTEDSGWNTGTKLNKCGKNLNAKKSKVGISKRKSHELWQKTFNRPCSNQLTLKHWNKKKARTLSNNKRGALPQHDREHLVRDMDITAHLEWVRKDKSGAIALILKRGEPSRLYFERIRHDGNWALFVASRMQEPPKGIQIYPDRGPLSRRKGQGKGKGGAASGSRGRGKGKGKGRKGNQ